MHAVIRRSTLLAAIALLAACGSPDSADETVEVVSTAGAASQGLPGGFGLPPDAQVVSNTSVDQNGESGVLVILQSTSEPQAMIDFYRTQAEAAGVPIANALDSDGTLMIGGESPAGVRFSITATPQDDGGTNAMLTIAQPAPPPVP